MDFARILRWILLFSVGKSWAEKINIGVIDGKSSADRPEVVRVSDDGNEDREIVVHWHYIDISESYAILKNAIEFQDRNADWIVINNSQSDIWKVVTGDTNSKYKFYRGSQNISLNEVTVDICHDNIGHNKELKIENDQPIICNVLDSVVDLLFQLHWASLVIIHDKESDFIAEQLKLILSRRGIFVMTFSEDQITGNEHYETIFTLDRVYKSFETTGVNVTVVCALECVQRVLNKANKYDHEVMNNHQTSMRQKSRWLILTRSDDIDRDIASFAYDLDNVAVINTKPMCQPSNDCPSILDTQSLIDFSEKADISATEVNVTLSTPRFDLIRRLLDEQRTTPPICLKCPIVTLMWTKYGAKIRTLHDSEDKRGFSTVGFLNITGGIELHGHVFPNADFGFNAREFLVTTNWEHAVGDQEMTPQCVIVFVEHAQIAYGMIRKTICWPPFMNRRSVNGTVEYFGFCKDLLDELSKDMNFTYRITEPVDGDFGFALQNGSWTGMVGQLQNEEVDMMISATSIQAGREMVMDFTHPFYFDSSTILMRKPDINKTKWKTLILPFDDIVHLCLWIVLPVAAFFLFIFERCSPYYESDDSEDHRTYQSAFWYMFGAMLTQGGDRTPESQSGRTLISFWWLFSIVMVATYSGNLIAFLTVTKEKLPFNSLQEMVMQDQYEWGTLSGTYFITMFKDSKLDVYKEIWAGIVKTNATDARALSSDPAIHIQKILSEDYVYFGDKVVMDMHRVNDCRLITVEEEIPNMSYGVGLPNHSPYTKLFSNTILTLLESGIFHIYEQRHWPKINFCKGSLTTEATPIEMIDVQSAFYLIGVGIGVGLLTLSAEVVYRCRRRCSLWGSSRGKQN